MQPLISYYRESIGKQTGETRVPMLGMELRWATCQPQDLPLELLVLFSVLNDTAQQRPVRLYFTCASTYGLKRSNQLADARVFFAESVYIRYAPSVLARHPSSQIRFPSLWQIRRRAPHNMRLSAVLVAAFLLLLAAARAQEETGEPRSRARPCISNC
jgi:hypothetical protein